MGFDTEKLKNAHAAAQAQMDSAITSLAAVDDLRDQDGHLPPPWDTFADRLRETEEAARQARDWAYQQLQRQ